VAAAAVPAGIFVFVVVRLGLRWCFALPILLEEPRILPITALRRSAERTRGRAARHLRAFGAWAVLVVGVSALFDAGFAALAGWILDRTGTGMRQALPVTGAVLAVWAALGLFPRGQPRRFSRVDRPAPPRGDGPTVGYGAPPVTRVPRSLV
jgi:hypothetical protein